VKDGTTIMRAMRAEGFSGYEDLKLVDIPKPAVSDGQVLVRITAARVTPLEHTILWGDTHEPKQLWSWEEREQA
jgi:NADPH2:quinone reductase